MGSRNRVVFKMVFYSKWYKLESWMNLTLNGNRWIMLMHCHASIAHDGLFQIYHSTDSGAFSNTTMRQCQIYPSSRDKIWTIIVYTCGKIAALKIFLNCKSKVEALCSGRLVPRFHPKCSDLLALSERRLWQSDFQVSARRGSRAHPVLLHVATELLTHMLPTMLGGSLYHSIFVFQFQFSHINIYHSFGHLLQHINFSACLKYLSLG